MSCSTDLASHVPLHDARAIRRAQHGLASLEFALCLPIIALLMVLALTVTRVGHLRLEMQSSARNAAHLQALHLDGLAGANSRPGWNGTALKGISTPKDTSKAGSDFISSNKLTNARFGKLQQSGATRIVIDPTVAVANEDFTAAQLVKGWTLHVRERHAVIESAIWERMDLPHGYDQYLRGRLKDTDFVTGNASDAVPSLFPKEK